MTIGDIKRELRLRDAFEDILLDFEADAGRIDLDKAVTSKAYDIARAEANRILEDAVRRALDVVEQERIAP